MLVRENNPIINKTILYRYDAGGNILDKKEYALTSGDPGTLVDTIGYSYDAVWEDKLTGYDGASITYDSIGNPLSYINGLTFTWDRGRQLESAVKTGLSVSYEYNDRGDPDEEDRREYCDQLPPGG